MMSDIEWTNESVIRLIQEYKRRRELWDKNHDLYRVQSAKYEAWASLASLFECDIADLRKKFNSVLASHRREKAKIRGGGRSSWFLYRYLNFLSNHLDQPDKDAVPEQDAIIEEDFVSEQEQEEEDSDGRDHDVLIKQEPAVEYICTKRLPPLRNCKRLKRTVQRKFVKDTPNTQQTPNSHIDSKLLEMLRLLKKSTVITKKKDECDSFGDYIAISLRKHDERTQSMIKQAINNILFEQEMKKYSAGQYTVVITGDENPLILGEAEATTS